LNNYNVFICIDDNDNIANLSDCSKIIVYDLVENKTVDSIEFRNRFDIDLIEIYIDKYDPKLFFTCMESRSDLIDSIEEYGIHVYLVNCPVKYLDLLNNI